MKWVFTSWMQEPHAVLFWRWGSCLPLTGLFIQWKIKVETVSSFTASLPCACVFMCICVCVCLSGQTERPIWFQKNPWVLINSTVHIFAFIFIICCMSQNTLISSPHDALMPFFYYCNTTPQLTGECQVSSKLCTNVLVVRLMETFVHSALVFNDVLKTLAQKCYLYIIYWSFLWDYLIESVLNVDNCFKMFKKHLKVTFL